MYSVLYYEYIRLGFALGNCVVRVPETGKSHVDWNPVRRKLAF